MSQRRGVVDKENRILTNEIICGTNERLFYLELQTDRYPYEISWEVRIIDDLKDLFYIWTSEDVIIARGGDYTLFYELYTEERCFPSNQCYQFRMKDSHGDGLTCGKKKCGFFRAEYDGGMVLESINDFSYRIMDSQIFGNCPTARPSISSAPSLSESPSLSPSVSPYPTVYYGMDNEPGPFFFFFIFGGLICFSCSCFATIIKNRNAERHRANSQSNTTRTDQEREERRAFILTHVIVEHRSKHTNSSDEEDILAEEKDGNKEERKSDSSGSSRQTIPIGSLRNLFQGLVGNSDSNTLKGVSISSLGNHELCAICLEGYNDNEEICRSRNKKCPHKFHLDCMVNWLMDHEQCPICRLPYLEEEIDLVNDDIGDEDDGTSEGNFDLGSNGRENEDGGTSEGNVALESHGRENTSGSEENVGPVTNAREDDGASVYSC